MADCAEAVQLGLAQQIVGRKTQSAGKFVEGLVDFLAQSKKLVNRKRLPIPICLASISACISEYNAVFDQLVGDHSCPSGFDSGVVVL